MLAWADQLKPAALVRSPAVEKRGRPAPAVAAPRTAQRGAHLMLWPAAAGAACVVAFLVALGSVLSGGSFDSPAVSLPAGGSPPASATAAAARAPRARMWQSRAAAPKRAQRDPISPAMLVMQAHAAASGMRQADILVPTVRPTIFLRTDPVGRERPSVIRTARLED